ncbi:MAG TPA: mandelate racemase/muconate lactonizing enzyme family protein [Propionibacteriaceae bacterium]
MRIADIRTRAFVFPLESRAAGADDNVSAREVLTIEVRTTDGSSGVSYLTGASRPGLSPQGQEVAVLKTAIDRLLAPIYVGGSVFERERLWADALGKTRRIGGKGAVMVALAGLDIALWDLAGKYAGLSVSQLLGGRRNKVPAYVLATPPVDDPAAVADDVSALVDGGFKLIKIKVGSHDLRKDLAKTAAAVKACRSGAKIIVDANEAWSVSEAAEYMAMARDLGIYWLEEPIPTHDLNGYRQLRSRSPIALALGDLESDLHAFRPYVVENLLGFTHADATRLGGLTPWLKLAHAAELWNVRCAAHAATEIHIHAVSAVANGAAVEYFDPQHRAQWPLDRLFPNAPELRTIRDGEILVPEVHGLGLDFDPRASEQYEIDV